MNFLYLVVDKIHQKNKYMIYFYFSSRFFISYVLFDFFIVLNFFFFNTKLIELFFQWKFSDKIISQNSYLQIKIN